MITHIHFSLLLRNNFQFEFRPGSEEVDAGLSIAKILRGQDDLAYEKNKAVITETLSKYKDLLTADLKLELEETKRKYEEDVAEILLRIKLSQNK